MTLFKEIVVLCSITVGFFFVIGVTDLSAHGVYVSTGFFTRKLCSLIELVSFLRLSTEIIVVKKDFFIMQY